jgi:transposase
VIGVSPNGVKIMVAMQPADFRRGMNGLVALVASALAADPHCGDMFVFRAKRLARLRCIYWDGSGIIRKRTGHPT